MYNGAAKALLSVYIYMNVNNKLKDKQWMKMIIKGSKKSILWGQAFDCMITAVSYSSSHANDVEKFLNQLMLKEIYF